jgi:hypothetical protein
MASPGKRRRKGLLGTAYHDRGWACANIETQHWLAVPVRIYVQHILRFNEARKQAQIGNLHHAEDGLA